MYEVSVDEQSYLPILNKCVIVPLFILRVRCFLHVSYIYIYISISINITILNITSIIPIIGGRGGLNATKT